MKVITNKIEYHKIWDQIVQRFDFKPHGTLAPFNFNCKYKKYKFLARWNKEQEILVNKIFREVFNCEIYALNWNHDCFTYNPNENIEYNYHYYDEERKCNVYFPTYYPEGDYYFFLSKDFTMGIFGHPWRKELYVIGDKLIEEFEANKYFLDLLGGYFFD